jgi:hypothetical protein
MNKYLAFTGVMCLAVLSGCGNSNVPVIGKVTYKGKPVTGGSLVFSPVAVKNELEPGKPAAAVIQEDGTFALATAKSAGAQAGKHRVTFSPPAQELSEAQRSDRSYTAPLPPYMGLTPQQVEVEVKSGMEEIEIVLVENGSGNR